MAHRPAQRVLLVGWDGADWDVVRPLANAGRMPHLTRLIDHGVTGELASLSPRVSAMLWTSIATSKRPIYHGILHDSELSATGPRTVSSGSRASNALWTILAHAGLRCHAIHWPASHPAERIGGVCVSEGFPVLGAAPGVIEPPSDADTWAQLHVTNADIDGPSLASLFPSGVTVDGPLAARMSQLLAETVSVHAAATHLVGDHAFDFCGVVYRGIEQFSHLFQRFAPPRLSSVSPEDFARYQSVVAEVYHLHDALLGRLIELSPPDTTVLVCSDHGFATGGQRPAGSVAPESAAAMWHRPGGLLVLAGLGVRHDDTVEGASILDLAPTILTLLGQPVGRDMEGRPLREALQRIPDEVPSIASWDAVIPIPASAAASSHSAWAAVEHLLELSYTDPLARRDEWSAAVYDQTLFNIGCAQLDAAQPERALAPLRFVLRRDPDDTAAAGRLFDALLLLERFTEARELVDQAVARRGPSLLSELAYASLDLASDQPAAALKHLAAASQHSTDLAEFHVLTGDAYLRLHRGEEAERAFDRALELDVRHESAWDGKASVLIRQQRYEQAIEAALRAVGLRANFAAAHFHLGVALAGADRKPLAVTALRRALALEPRLLPAHELLAELLEGSDPRGAQDHRLRAAQIALRRRTQQAL